MNQDLASLKRDMEEVKLKWAYVPWAIDLEEVKNWLSKVEEKWVLNHKPDNYHRATQVRYSRLFCLNLGKGRNLLQNAKKTDLVLKI